jgi:hypothetical protein
MTLRDRATETSIPRPSLSQIADGAEVITLLAGAALVLTIAAFGVAGIVLGFSVGLAVGFANIAAGIFLFGASFFGLSLLIGLIETTYYVEQEEETLPEQAAEAQGDEELDVEQIGEHRAPEEHRVK